MKNTQTLEVEITIKPAHGRRGGRGRKSEPTAPALPRIPRITRLMALAIKFQDLVDRGDVRDYADIARLGYVTRARLTQIMNLSLLAPEIEEGILFIGNSGASRETQLRVVVALPYWQDQLHAARERFSRRCPCESGNHRVEAVSQ
jgi:hypothetical protein